MMKRLCSLFMMLCFVSALFAVTKADADALYVKEKYAEAAKAYEGILKEGIASEVYYNLGNCYYKIDEIPLAILNYERALQMSPGDSDTRSNLALARGKTIDKVVPPSEMFFVTWWRNLTNIMSLGAWSMIGVVSFILMLCGVCAYMLMSNLLVRKIGIYGAICLLVLCLVANLAAVTQHFNVQQRDAAIVMSAAVTVKSSPSEKSTDLFVIHEGSKVSILDSTMKDWMEVKFEEGKQGWVRVSDIEII